MYLISKQRRFFKKNKKRLFNPKEGKDNKEQMTGYLKNK